MDSWPAERHQSASLQSTHRNQHLSLFTSHQVIQKMTQSATCSRSQVIQITWNSQATSIIMEMQIRITLASQFCLHRLARFIFFPATHSSLFLTFRYVLALLDPSASTLTMAPTQTFILNRAVKRLKPTTERQQTEVKDYLARAKDRNALGEAFGTRKSKSRIKAAERNAVDTAGMEGSRKGLLLGVEQGGQNMLSAGTLGLNFTVEAEFEPNGRCNSRGNTGARRLVSIYPSL